ncbi:MAG TPA: hypothetical protein VKP30_30235, partial [Polyangiaceae bacterium]|nr:hypothetical protein [Polyangiaceae bacterium]
MRDSERRAVDGFRVSDSERRAVSSQGTLAFGFFFLGLLGAVTLGLGGCTRARPSESARASEPSRDVVDYSLTQLAQNQPDRATCSGGRCKDDAAQREVPGRCDLELCEGELAPSAIAELRATAEKANDCYERELKEQNLLEGKMVVRLRLAAGREPCEVRVEQSSLKGSDNFINCVLDRLRRTEARPTSGCVDIALPLSFVR